MRLSIAEIIEATSGEIAVAPSDIETAATDLVWDSREAGAGCLYAALPGERVDGHAFVASAIRSGAVCALVAQDPDPDAADAAREAGAAIVKVSDTQQALVDLARFWRGKLGGRIIGLTGSSGKTTTKNLVRDVLSAGFAVTATSGNQNNELGVPKTVLSASADDGAVVVEMGMRGMGQIEQLCGYVRPEWGIIVNVGTSHMELLGSRENIARAKAELLEALPAGGCAFINGADDYAAFARDHARLRERGVKVVVFDGSPEAAGRMDVLKGARLADADEQGAAVRRWGEPLHAHAAVDNHPFKVKLLKERASEYGLDSVEGIVADATRLQGDLEGREFDLVFIDAPCSGLGTLRRHPEIRWRITPAHIDDLARTQLALLRSAATCVSVGGTLAYATCTVTRKENFDVVKAFLASPEGSAFALAPIGGRSCFAPQLVPGSSDAHFAVVFVRKSGR